MLTLLDLLFPKKCVGCFKIGDYFCPNCIQTIVQTELVCPFCERPSLGGVTHPVCKRKTGLDGLWSLGVYQNPLKGAIQKIKYRYIKGLTQNLVGILVDYWVRYQPLLLDKISKDKGQNWVVVPVPLHWTRQNWRGFNQSEELGQILSKKLGLGYYNCLKRNRITKAQVGLLSSDRKTNIKDAFCFNTKYKIGNTNVLLVDDVWTTGATLKECGKVLKKAGAKFVWALTLAR